MLLSLLTLLEMLLCRVACLPTPLGVWGRADFYLPFQSFVDEVVQEGQQGDGHKAHHEAVTQLKKNEISQEETTRINTEPIYDIVNSS